MAEDGHPPPGKYRPHKSPAMELRPANGQGDHTIRLLPTPQTVSYFLVGSLLWVFYLLLVPTYVFAAYLGSDALNIGPACLYVPQPGTHE